MQCTLTDTNRHPDTEAEFSTFVPNIGSFSWQARVVRSYSHLEGHSGEPVYGNSVRQNDFDSLKLATWKNGSMKSSTPSKMLLFLILSNILGILFWIILTYRQIKVSHYVYKIQII